MTKATKKEWTIGMVHAVRSTFLVQADTLEEAIDQARRMHRNEPGINPVLVEHEPIAELPMDNWGFNELSSSDSEQTPIPKSVIQEIENREHVEAIESCGCGSEQGCNNHETAQVS